VLLAKVRPWFAHQDAHRDHYDYYNYGDPNDQEDSLVNSQF